MKYVDEYRRGDEAQKLAQRIREEADAERDYRTCSRAGASRTSFLPMSA